MTTLTAQALHIEVEFNQELSQIHKRGSAPRQIVAFLSDLQDLVPKFGTIHIWKGEEKLLVGSGGGLTYQKAGASESWGFGDLESLLSDQKFITFGRNTIRMKTFLTQAWSSIFQGDGSYIVEPITLTSMLKEERKAARKFKGTQ